MYYYPVLKGCHNTDDRNVTHGEPLNINIYTRQKQNVKVELNSVRVQLYC